MDRLEAVVLQLSEQKASLLVFKTLADWSTACVDVFGPFGSTSDGSGCLEPCGSPVGLLEGSELDTVGYTEYHGVKINDKGHGCIGNGYRDEETCYWKQKSDVAAVEKAQVGLMSHVGQKLLCPLTGQLVVVALALCHVVG